MSKWVRIDDESVHHIWQCPECEAKATIWPDDYQDIGTPMCSDCECDMEYLYTETLVDG